MTFARHCLVMFLLAAPLAAQAPSAHWKTLRTQHFRFEYPQDYEAWTMRAAAHAESIRDAVVHEVGYSPDTVTDIIVMNPIAEPNGITLPLIGYPRILLFTEPPEPEVEIGEFRNWIDLLTVHEMTHLVHLLRPSRNTLDHLIERTLPLNPITLHAPRWVMEGYATVIEGKITGYGRPSSSIRAAILRKWAASGRLPSYAQLDSDHRFIGMSMAYLMGSAYLEWLEQRGGPDSLRNLWARMTARQRRSFDTAFQGVFGDSPSRLYGMFTAELTQRAVDIDRTIESREGELWLETKRNSGDPAVSPDGKQIAIVERDDRGESKLRIYSTGPNAEEEKLRERIAKMLQRDPEDVAPTRNKPVPRKPLHTFEPFDSGGVETPRWTRDGTALLFTHKQPDRDGFLHDDLFLWNPATNELGRLTHLADVHDADPLPGGHSAIAVRNRFGWSQLVKVDLATGEATAFTKPSLDQIYSHPRAASDGRIAWAEHDAGGWHIVVDGVQRDDGYTPEWGADGALYSVVAHGGFIDIARDGAPITRTTGALSQPAPAPDGSIYFMSLETGGYELRRSSTPSPVPSGGQPTPAVDFVPALPPRRATPVMFAGQPFGQSHDYGIGHQEWRWLAAGAWTPYEHRLGLGIRLGDVLDRFDTVAVVVNGSDRGAAIASAWRGWPVTIVAHAYTLRTGCHPERSEGSPSQVRGGFLADCAARNDTNIELRAEYEAHAPGLTTFIEAGVSPGAFATGEIALEQKKISEMLRVTANGAGDGRATLAAGAALGGFHFRLTADAGRRLEIGGFASSVVPDGFRVRRFDDPALPEKFAFAEHFRSARADVESGFVTLFWRRYDLARNVDVRGLEVALAAPPLGLLKTPAFDVTAGVAKVSASRGVKGWIALRWRP